MTHTVNHTQRNVSKPTVKQPHAKTGKVSKAVNASKAKRHAKKIIEALDEAEQVHKGKRKGKTFEEFLKKL